MISVVMPAYNAEKTIRQAMDSVLNQTFSNFELIVIDDCSEDRTQTIVERYVERDERVILVKNKQNSGVSVSRNKGISLAQGEYIAFLDSDDMWREDKLEKQMEAMERKSVVISYTASRFMDDDGKIYNYVMQAEEKTTLSAILKRNIISCSSVVVKSDIMKDLKMPGDNMHEDYYVWIKILVKYPFAYGVKEPLLIYRLSAGSKSGNRLKSAKMIYHTYRAVGYSPLVGMLLTLRYAFYSISKRYKIKYT